MATVAGVMAALKSKASDKTRATYARHGAPAETTLGVSVADIKLIAKPLKRQQALACELYDTGIFEAMYLAGILADGSQMTTKQLDAWAEAATASMITDYTVAWVAVENADARKLAVTWIGSKKEHVAAAGWRTYAGLVTTKPDAELDLAEVQALLKAVVAKIHEAPNRVRAAMNGFVISVASYVRPLESQAKTAAKAMSPVSVDVGDTACKVPSALEYIAKVEASGRAGVKRKTIRC